MRNIPVIIFSLCCATVLAAACKKSSKTSIQHNDITGKWRKTRIAVDTNGNRLIDNLELLSVSAYDSTHILVFNNDGSGQITYMNTNVGAFSWSLENNNTYLKIVYAGLSSAIEQHIDTLTADAMTLRDTTGISVIWNLFTKQ